MHILDRSFTDLKKRLKYNSLKSNNKQKQSTMSKVKEMIWFTSGIDTIGIALTDNGHEKKAQFRA